MKKTLLTALLALAALGLKAQQADPVVIEVGGQRIRQSELMKDFMQSVGDNLVAKHGVTAAEKRKALDEYVDLYAIFRAKVIDARAMGLDTASDLQAELMRYRAELAAPYLIDSSVLQRILHEAYDRNHYILHAAHILVRVAENASPDDSLAAYNRALELRKRVVSGENFADVAISEVRRTKPNAKVRPDEGDLGYFSALDMVYPFENAVYALKVGEVSQPVRTTYGYHIIKLIDRVEFYGKLTLQHIWMRDDKAQVGIDEAYERILGGAPFEMVARQSQDYSTAETGGYLSDVAVNQIPSEYVKVLSRMNVGEVSRPFYTRYGWHIVKLVQRDSIPSYEDMEPFYKQRLVRDQRGKESRKAFAASVRKKYGIVDLTRTPVATKPAKKGKKKQPVVMQASLDELTGLLNDSVFSEKWRYRTADIHDLRPLVRTPNSEYNALDLANYIRHHQPLQMPEPFSTFMYKRYNDFLDSVSIVYADSQLENENPEFAETVDEYRRGLMIFNYNDKMIWSKAINDSVGFADFYARDSRTKSLANPADSIFFWRQRARVVVLHVADSLCLAPAKARSAMQKALKKNHSSSTMKETLLAKVDVRKCTAPDPVTANTDLVELNRQNLLAADQWQRGVYLAPEGKGYRIVVVQDILEPTLKEHAEARGYYLNAWQNEVEQGLVKQLRSKYNIKINRDAVSKINY